MTTAHMLHLLVMHWHHIAAHGWRFPKRWHLALRYLDRLTGNRDYSRMLLRFFEHRHIGPRKWARWNQA